MWWATRWWRGTASPPGRRIGSLALVADGGARPTDGLSSLAVVASGVASLVVGLYADPVVGLVIAALIARLFAQTARPVPGRLLDDVDPHLVDRVGPPPPPSQGGRVDQTQVRWLGHRARAELAIAVDPSLSLAAAHEIAEHVEGGRRSARRPPRSSRSRSGLPRRTTDQRVHHRQRREPGRSPDRATTGVLTPWDRQDGRDPSVMDPWAHDRTRLEQTRQRLDVSGPFAEEMDRGGPRPTPAPRPVRGHGRRWVVDPRVRHHREELMRHGHGMAQPPGAATAARGRAAARWCCESSRWAYTRMLVSRAIIAKRCDPTGACTTGR